MACGDLQNEFQSLREELVLEESLSFPLEEGRASSVSEANTGSGDRDLVDRPDREDEADDRPDIVSILRLSVPRSLMTSAEDLILSDTLMYEWRQNRRVPRSELEMGHK